MEAEYLEVAAAVRNERLTRAVFRAWELAADESFMFWWVFHTWAFDVFSRGPRMRANWAWFTLRASQVQHRRRLWSGFGRLLNDIKARGRAA